MQLKILPQNQQQQQQQQTKGRIAKNTSRIKKPQKIAYIITEKQACQRETAEERERESRQGVERELASTCSSPE